MLVTPRHWNRVGGAAVLLLGLAVAVAGVVGLVVGTMFGVVVPALLPVAFWACLYLGLLASVFATMFLAMLDGGVREPGALRDVTYIGLGFYLLEWPGGISLGRRPPAGLVANLEAGRTFGGFELLTPNRFTLGHALGRITFGAALNAAIVVLPAILGSCDYDSPLTPTQAMGITSVYVGLVTVPSVALAGMLAGAIHLRRSRIWTGSMQLEGPALTVDQGRFVFGVKPDVELFIDRSGAGMCLSDPDQRLVFRAPYAALHHLREQLPRIVRVEGSGEDVPAALRYLRQQERAGSGL